MRISTIVVSIILAAFRVHGQEQSIEDGWKGIKVFKTTRAIVEKLLGEPSPESGKVFTIYPHPEAHVSVIYSNSRCSAVPNAATYDLEKGTVLEYMVNLRTPIPLADLKWKKDDYGGGPDKHRLGLHHYTNTDGSVWITTRMIDGKELVQGYWFNNTLEQRKSHSCEKKKPTAM